MLSHASSHLPRRELHHQSTRLEAIKYLNISFIWSPTATMEEVQRHSVHTLVFRSLKRSHDFFVSNQPIISMEADEKT